MQKKNYPLSQRPVKALKYSIQGLGYAYRQEQAFRVEVWLGCLSIPPLLALSPEFIWSLLLIISFFLLLLTELLNSALEALAEKISPEFDSFIGAAKDMGSAAVLMALSIYFLLVGVIVYQYFGN